ncbi:MAG: exosortase/archaeosortase family protein [Phycisphaeraceae bacterium]|nr:exosortase/archaeosortase family protein [Phycisphaeraceae bacterium]MBX3407734.1 exosortase/archaeosortase family protein [Phycisphaeraceae bacterium]
MTTTPGRVPGIDAASAAPRTLAESVADPEVIGKFVLLAGATVFLFWNWIYAQHQHSWGNGDWSHAYMVPLISAYLLWQVRRDFDAAAKGVFWPGLLPVAMGIWCHVFFTVGIPNHLGQGLSLILTVFGVALLLLGTAAMRSLFLPIGYLFFAITLPQQVMIRITFPLQQIAAEGAWVLLRVLGIQADLVGNTIHVLNTKTLVTTPLDVAQACSGMRMLIAFIALGTAVGLVASRMWWKRVALISLGVPVALGLNMVRVAVLGILSLWDADLSQGEAHTFIGTVLLVPGFFIYMGVVWALNRAVPEQQEGPA